MVEAAIVAPLLVLLTFTIVDFSSLFYVYLALENGVSQATRYGVTGNTMGTLSRSDSIKTAMRQATPTLTIADAAFTFTHLPVGGAAWVAGTGGPDEVEKLTVDYTWTFFTPLMKPFFANNQIKLRVASTMKNEGKFQ
jgi:Flp pilus assembly protein TadG